MWYYLYKVVRTKVVQYMYFIGYRPDTDPSSRQALGTVVRDRTRVVGRTGQFIHAYKFKVRCGPRVCYITGFA